MVEKTDFNTQKFILLQVGHNMTEIRFLDFFKVLPFDGHFHEIELPTICFMFAIYCPSREITRDMSQIGFHFGVLGHLDINSKS